MILFLIAVIVIVVPVEIFVLTWLVVVAILDFIVLVLFIVLFMWSIGTRTHPITVPAMIRSMLWFLWSRSSMLPSIRSSMRSFMRSSTMPSIRSFMRSLWPFLKVRTVLIQQSWVCSSYPAKGGLIWKPWLIFGTLDA